MRYHELSEEEKKKYGPELFAIVERRIKLKIIFWSNWIEMVQWDGYIIQTLIGRKLIVLLKLKKLDNIGSK